MTKKERERFEILLEEIRSDVKVVLDGHTFLSDGMKALEKKFDCLEGKFDHMDKKHDRNFQMLYDLMKDTKEDLGRKLDEHIRKPAHAGV